VAVLVNISGLICECGSRSVEVVRHPPMALAIHDEPTIRAFRCTRCCREWQAVTTRLNGGST
jgi:hypothetical protein